MSKHWTLDDIDWDKFDPSLLDADLIATIKTAAMVEGNAADYVTYLLGVFEGDEDFSAVVHQWGEEEKQHGAALGRWARMADPDFDYNASLERVQQDGYQIETDAKESVRGSRQGELLARCLVESGTTSFYSAIRDGTEEPVLKQIAANIAADEVRHYSLFRRHLERYERTVAKLGLMERIRIILGRINESDDDEFAFAYYATNLASKGDVPYDREYCAAAYESHALGLYERNHLELGAQMIMRSLGFKPDSRTSRTMVPVMWKLFDRRRRKLAQTAQAA